MHVPQTRLAVTQLFNLLQRVVRRQRHYWKSMDSDLLKPPTAVRGMLELDREMFRKCVKVPRLHVLEERANKVLPLLKKLLLKMEQLRPVRTVTDGTVDQTSKCTIREILLHPVPVTSWDSLPTADLKVLQVQPEDFAYTELELSYANWRTDEILKSVLPTDEEGLTSFSRIGHIVHLNLRDHLLPYKQLIGQVLCDKVVGCRTVVNKLANIDNTYRNFQLELICGVEDYQVETKENGVTFEFDFSRVYWNPRLCTEHERIVQLLQPGDVLYDVFAGVGPFSVPAAKKRCFVLANDLNPESFRWLQHNSKRNKCIKQMQLFNKDGRDFILDDLKQDLLKRWSEKAQTYNMHITMNLPAMAVEFLSAFRGLYQTESTEINFSEPNFNFPLVHVYCFAKGQDGTRELAQSLVEEHLGLPLQQNLQGIHFVRNVAPNKDMYRVSFFLTAEILMKPIIAAKSTHGVSATEQAHAALKRAAADEEEPHCAKLKCS